MIRANRRAIHQPGVIVVGSGEGGGNLVELAPFELDDSAIAGGIDRGLDGDRIIGHAVADRAWQTSDIAVIAAQRHLVPFRLELSYRHHHGGDDTDPNEFRCT